MAIPLRPDFDAATLRLWAKRSKDGAQARRLLALAAIYDGATRAEAACLGSVTVQIVRDWVLKFNAHGPADLIDRKPPGQPSRLTDEHWTALVQAIEDGPVPAIHGVVRWRLTDMCQWLWKTFQVGIAKPTLSREVRARLPQAFGPPAPPRPGRRGGRGIKKTSPRAWKRSRASAASTSAP